MTWPVSTNIKSKLHLRHVVQSFVGQRLSAKTLIAQKNQVARTPDSLDRLTSVEPLEGKSESLEV